MHLVNSKPDGVTNHGSGPTPLALWGYFFCTAFFAITLCFAAIIPAFQAPDEFEHVKREYMLSRGQILLHSSQESPSGGRVDSGLMKYMDFFTPVKGNAARKVSTDELTSSAQVRWSGSYSFEVSAVTGSYFPALYAPAALGLLIGRSADLSVSQSYRLSRFLSLLACSLILAVAVRMWRLPAVVFALLALPMNIFLVSSSVLDGTALATFVLSMSAFFRVLNDRENTSRRVFLTLVISITLVAACRANTLPMLILPFVAAWYTRNRRHAAFAAIAVVFVMAWTLYTIGHTVYPVGARHADHAGRLTSFITHPGNFVELLWNTLTDLSIVSFYGYSFIGILGWFDAALPLSTYPVIAAALIGVLLTSISIKNVRTDGLARAAILLAVLGTVLLTFLALLVQWTPDGATRIDGVQGRYFMIPAVALAYAISSGPWAPGRIRTVASHALVSAMLLGSAAVTASTVIARYHTVDNQPQAATPPLSVSTPLTRNMPIKLRFVSAQTLDPAPLRSIAVRVGTYMTSHEGNGELRLWTADGHMIKHVFPLASLSDNAYARIDLDNKPYVSGEIASAGGEGISVYEYQLNPNALFTCLILEKSDGTWSSVPGCPADDKAGRPN